MNTIGTVKRTEDHIYVNLNQYNTGTIDEVVNIQKTFSEVILPNSSDYEMSVIRFDLYGFNIPIINLQNYFVNNTAPTTILQVKMIYNSTEFTRPLIWVPFSSYPNDYLYYDYNHFSTIVNNAINLCCSDINTAFPGTIVQNPRLEYDPLTTRYALYADGGVFGDALVNPVQIWFNGVLYDLLHSLPYQYFQSGNPDFLRLSIRQIFNPTGTDNSKVISGITNYVMLQEYQSLICMNSAKSIVLTSDLPIVEEYITSVGSDFTGGNTSTIQYPIVSDFILDSPNGYELFNHIIYNPTAEYRMLSLTGSRPIQSIKMKLFYQDANGVLTPVLIAGKRRINIKIMFRKKNWKNNK